MKLTDIFKDENVGRSVIDPAGEKWVINKSLLGNFQLNNDGQIWSEFDSLHWKLEGWELLREIIAVERLKNGLIEISYNK